MELEVKGPFEIEAKHIGEWLHYSPWRLKLASNGEMAIEILRRDGRSKRTRLVNEDDIARIRKAINKNGFFELPESIGQGSPGFGRRELQISVKDHAKTVSIEDEPGEMTVEEANARKRALEIWEEICRFVTDADAAR